MEKKGINIIEKALKGYSGKDAIISTFHKLYGGQKIRCKLNCILDEKRIGFKVKNGQEIFVYKDEVVDYGTKDGIYFADDLMEINIRLQEQ